MLEQIFLAVVNGTTFAVVLGGIGALYMRYVCKNHINEEIKRRSEVVALAEKMRAVGISNEEVVAMLGSIERDRKAATAIQALEVDAIESREIHEINNAKTQQEMNRAAGRRLERLNLQLEHTLERLRLRMDGERLQKLDGEQQARLEFREKVAEFAGEPWGRGTMRPFIVAGAMSRVTKQRIADLEAEVKQYEGEQ